MPDLEVDETGKPLDKSYLEVGVPSWLRESADAMALAWEKAEEDPFSWEPAYYDLCSNINIAEVEQMISPEQAWYFREKYLHIVREELP